MFKICILGKFPTISDARFELSVKDFRGFMVQTWIARFFISCDFVGSLGPWQHGFFGPAYIPE